MHWCQVAGCYNEIYDPVNPLTACQMTNGFGSPKDGPIVQGDDIFTTIAPGTHKCRTWVYDIPMYHHPGLLWWENLNTKSLWQFRYKLWALRNRIESSPCQNSLVLHWGGGKLEAFHLLLGWGWGRRCREGLRIKKLAASLNPPPLLFVFRIHPHHHGSGAPQVRNYNYKLSYYHSAPCLLQLCTLFVGLCSIWNR